MSRQILHRLDARLAEFHRAEGQLGNGHAITATTVGAEAMAVVETATTRRPWPPRTGQRKC